jgi:hypothetical protein
MQMARSAVRIEYRSIDIGGSEVHSVAASWTLRPLQAARMIAHSNYLKADNSRAAQDMVQLRAMA